MPFYLNRNTGLYFMCRKPVWIGNWICNILLWINYFRVSKLPIWSCINLLCWNVSSVFLYTQCNGFWLVVPICLPFILLKQPSKSFQVNIQKQFQSSCVIFCLRYCQHSVPEMSRSFPWCIWLCCLSFSISNHFSQKRFFFLWLVSFFKCKFSFPFTWQVMNYL